MVRHVCMVLMTFAVLSGCGEQKIATTTKKQSTDDGPLTLALETLRDERSTHTNINTALQHRNNYLASQSSATQQTPLAKELQAHFDELLKNLPTKELQDAWGESLPLTKPAVLRELTSTAHTLIDSHHVDSCILFSDAAYSLRRDIDSRMRSMLTDSGESSGNALTGDDPALVRNMVDYCFRWTMRHVQLQPGRKIAHWPTSDSLNWRALREKIQRGETPSMELDPWPPHDVLRRGFGTAEERASVVLSLLDQLPIYANKSGRERVPVVACLVYPALGGSNDSPVWIGIQLEKELFLYDPETGRPLLGSDKKHLNLSMLVKGASAVYKGEPKQVESCQLVPTAPIHFSAPRMQDLQGWIHKHLRDDVILYRDPLKMLEALKPHTDAKVKLSPWHDEKQREAASLTLLRHVRNPNAQPRLEAGRFKVLTDSAGRVMREAVELPREGLACPRSAIRSSWFHQLAEALRDIDCPHEAERLYTKYDAMFRRLRLDGDSPRDLMLRGRIHASLDALLRADAELNEVLTDYLRRTNMEEPTRAIWAPQLFHSYAQISPLRKENLQPSDADRYDDFTKLNKQADSLWRQYAMQLQYLAYNWSAPELRQLLAYYLGLVYMDLAAEEEALLQFLPGKSLDERKNETIRYYQAAELWFDRYLALSNMAESTKQWRPNVEILKKDCEESRARLGQATNSRNE